MKKTLIVYYSRRGENYVDGEIRNLTVGNTELAAAVLEKLTGGECFRIEPCRDYPEDYYRCIDLAQQDLQRGVRPKLKALPDSIVPYEVIYLGFPIYWGTMPMPIFSFLEQFDFTGKIIKPFCTNEGSGLGHSVLDLKRLCPAARVTEGFSIRGVKIKRELSALEEWTREM